MTGCRLSVFGFVDSTYSLTPLLPGVRSSVERRAEVVLYAALSTVLCLWYFPSPIIYNPLPLYRS